MEGTVRQQNKTEKERGDSASALFKASLQSTMINVALWACHHYYSLQLHQQAGTAPRMTNHVQDVFNFMRQD